MKPFDGHQCFWVLVNVFFEQLFVLLCFLMKLMGALTARGVCTKNPIRPTLKTFLFPLTQPCFTGMGRSVRIFFLTSNWIPIKLNCIQ